VAARPQVHPLARVARFPMLYASPAGADPAADRIFDAGLPPDGLDRQVRAPDAARPVRPGTGR
jgi:hypothetical protein